LDKFEQFKRKYDPQYAAKIAQGGNKLKVTALKWPEKKKDAAKEAKKEEEDLYT
jgi:hypothetical protein